MSLKTRLNIMPISEEHNLDNSFLTLKEELYELFIEKINSTPPWLNYDSEQQKELTRQFIENQLSSKFKSVSLEKSEKEMLVKEIFLQTQGFGPLGVLLNDSEVSEVFVNGAKHVYVKKNGNLCKSDLIFKNNKHLKNIIDLIILRTGKKLDEKNPIIEAKFPNGFYINAVTSPVSLNGPVLSIKKTSKERLTLENLMSQKVLTNEVTRTISNALKAKLNIIITGQKDCGKTSLLNALAAEIPAGERIITIEDFSQLTLEQEHVVKFETKSSISTKDLLENALKIDPDRIIIGECKGAEVSEIIQAINTGQEGFLTTLWAKSPKDALDKIEAMCANDNGDFIQRNIRMQIATAINLIIHMQKLPDGSNKITSVTEIIGFDGNSILTQEIFRFEKTGLENTNFIGCHTSTGTKPKFIEKLKEKNLTIPTEYFNKERKHTYFKDTSEDSDIRSKLIRETGSSALSQRLRK